jgi:pyrroloquinoline quinone biosynthesis protein B
LKIFQILYLIFFLIAISCNSSDKEKKQQKSNQYITVLGIAQDAGYPQIDCEKECCKAYFEGKESRKLIACLGLVDLQARQKWLFDATPDFSEQAQIFKDNHLDNSKVIDGIFITHAHIGHYTGLMYLGFEALGGDNIPVYAMPRMNVY